MVNMTSELLWYKIFIHSYFIFIKEKEEVLAPIALVVLFSAVLKHVCSLFLTLSVYDRKIFICLIKSSCCSLMNIKKMLIFLPTFKAYKSIKFHF